MGSWGGFFFGEEDSVIIEEIAKLHKFPKEAVEKHYKEMIVNVKTELSK